MKTKWIVRTVFPKGYGAELAYNTRRRAVDHAIANDAKGYRVNVYKIDAKGKQSLVKFLIPNHP